jgi:APA family basic amino acid/polyamine antiporter
MSRRHTQDKIGLWPLTSLVTGNLVGSGVYLLPATLAIYGTVSIFGWIAASVGAIILSLVFAELSSHQTKTGGPYLYAREAFGDTVGYYVCWGYWVLMWMSNPALAIGAVGYISSLCGGLSQMTHFLLEILVVAGLTTFNLLGLKITGRAELFITMLKVIPLLVLPLIGLYFIDLSTLTQHVNVSDKPFGTALNAATLAAMWAFVGLETGTIPAGQVYNASKTVPRATILGTVIAAIVYILGAVVVMGVVSPVDLLQSKAPYADAAQSIFGGAWGAPVTFAAIISCLGSLNGYLIIVGRIPYGAAQDGLFPQFFTRTTDHGTPYWGVLISSLCSIPLLLLSLKSSLMEQFNFIIEIATMLILVVYAVSSLAYLKIMIRDKKTTFLKVILSLSGLAFACWALWAASFTMVALSMIIVILGIPMRIWMTRSKVALDQA